jgi:hypothetical protein
MSTQTVGVKGSFVIGQRGQKEIDFTQAVPEGQSPLNTVVASLAAMRDASNEYLSVFVEEDRAKKKNKNNHNKKRKVEAKTN